MSTKTHNHSAYQKLVATLGTTEKKMEALKGKGQGQTCVILTCGPSLSEYEADHLKALCKNVTVIAIKQAFAYVPEVCDFLLLNTWNYQKYDFSKHRPCIMYEKGLSDPQVFGEHDIVLNIPKVSDLSLQLARSKRYDDYTFDKQLERPWGPGVLYELGFYLAEYMQFNKIVTLGWDVGGRNTSVMSHFYDIPSKEKTRALAQARRIRNLPEKNKFLHDNFILYNKPRIIPEEVDICALASEDWYDWLTSKNIDLQVVSKVSAVSERIPRVRLEDVL